MTAEKKRPRILCVDDEPNVLEGLSLHLRRRFDVATAQSGADALALLERDGPTDAIISDMRMPGMDGATFLAKARQRFPDSVRMLLTGQADMASAISAVNDGQIFRFLTKPCAPADMLAAVTAAVEQHRLITSERVLLEQTLHGSIKALTDVLALTHPTSFGRAMRIKQNVSDMLDATAAADRWQVEVAAMLSQLGSVALPPDVSEKVYFGRDLSPQEQAMVARVPQVTEQLLGNIPRLEVVRHMLSGLDRPLARDAVASDADRQLVARGVQMLRIAVDYDVLEGQGSTAQVAFSVLRGRQGRYDAAILEAFAAARGEAAPTSEIRELGLAQLVSGMVVAQDVMMTSGALLVARGYELTGSLLERLRNFRPGSVCEPIRVVVRMQRAAGRSPAA
ncbi:MAG TPA: response regulator [Kofleriaceae bacterium]|nr:response regulator [Kofleriaceae bacterium]